MFQRLMTAVLEELDDYLDDIIIYSYSFEEHLLHLQLVFDKLRAAGLKLNPSKCFCPGNSKVQYMGLSSVRKELSTTYGRLKLSSNFHGLQQSKKFVSLLALPRTIDVLLIIFWTSLPLYMHLPKQMLSSHGLRIVNRHI